MDERETRRFPTGPATKRDGEDQVGYTKRLRQLALESGPLDPGVDRRMLLWDKVVAHADDFM
jgi:hypothetical protein